MPHRGQPIDFKYLSDIARSIDAIETSISKKSKISIGETQRDINTVDVKIETAKVSAVNPNPSATNAAGTEITYTFTAGFGYAPTVTVTPMFTATSTIKPEDIDVIITSITAQQVKFKVGFNVKGNIPVTINLIAIGIPAGL